ncbi:endonuclease/exonuclease/phosphatase family protein [Nocardia colli]|uniref:Endonuclease/exonuclease/phosphatase family protein n=1 Tax=Nocardia colli TaxID=2545717 RepID=A0A5N0EJT4_9NOCA|nr:endonuclease/exonuclease/phosphatase family protein [Nocardia colli]KAA8888295.1 endonuclease/exonuclease/phosphatase family protein [Nocardia colli]
MRLSKALLTAVLLASTALVGAAPLAQADDHARVRVLTWNILHGGREPTPDNLNDLIDQVIEIKPDVFFAVETYGSGETITDALTRRAHNGRYTGVKITDRPAGQDNLWIFTEYDVVATYPKPQGGPVSDFDLGGVRVRVPHDGELNLFATWLTYTDPWDGYLIDENAIDRRDGREPRNSVAAVVQAERAQTQYITDIVHNQIPRMLGGNTAPILLGGDFNTLPGADWTPAQANCPNHFGLSYPLTATKAVTDAGFVDTFRAANPDVCAVPGRTWSPLPTEQLLTDQRIDFLFATGQVETRESRIIDQRLRRHGPGVFYSDHAAVVSDLKVRW